MGALITSARIRLGAVIFGQPVSVPLLGQLVGAERPSITHALARLAHAGLVTGTTCDLHLNGTLDRHLEILLERTNSSRTQGLDGRSEPQRIA